MKSIIAIVGPTAVGKTALSISLAKLLQAEVISADSMQFYRQLNIGTAKIKESETEGIKHHLIDILDPMDSFNVSSYQKIVRNQIDALLSRHQNIILVGGSGLYLQSVLFDYLFQGDLRDDSFEHQYDSYTNEQLFEKLKEMNDELALKVHPNNRRRLLRSLQIAQDVESSSKSRGQKYFYPNVLIVGLEMPRELLYQRINQRVDEMISDGLIEEVHTLYQSGIHGQSVQAIGYKELYQYFDGLVSLDEAIEKIKQSSRRYAKRQMTWFKNKMDVLWFDVTMNSMDDIVKQILEEIKK